VIGKTLIQQTLLGLSKCNSEVGIYMYATTQEGCLSDHSFL